LNAATMAAHQFVGGFLEQRFAAAADMDVRAELKVFGGDLLAETRSTPCHENTLPFQQIALKHVPLSFTLMLAPATHRRVVRRQRVPSATAILMEYRSSPLLMSNLTLLCYLWILGRATEKDDFGDAKTRRAGGRCRRCRKRRCV